MKKLIKYFLQGVVLVIPLAVTFFVLYKIFFLIDNLFKDLLPIKVPGFGILVILISLTALGYVGQSVIFQPFRSLFKSLIEKAPLIKVIYSSVSDLLTAFVGQKKKFNHPVRVKVSKVYDVEKLGFITQSDLSDLAIEGGKVAVYFPHSYAWSGELFVVPVENIITIDAPPAEVMKFIVSGGITKI